jgi:dienelactone hydrolase
MTIVRLLVGLAAMALSAAATAQAPPALPAREVLLLYTPDGVQLSALLSYPASGFNAAAPAVIHIADGPGLPLIAAAGPARFLAEDLAQRGYGNLALETRLTERYAFSRFDESITDIKTAIDALAARGITRVVLAGTGLGAAQAARYAGQAADARVRGLILLAPGEDLAVSLANRLGTQRSTELVDTATRALESGERGFVDLGDGIIFTPAAFLDWFRPGTGTATTENLANVNVPLLLAAGGSDPLNPRTRLDRLKAAAFLSSGAVVKTYVGAGGDLSSARDQLLADVVAWLAGIGLTSPPPVRTQVLDVKSADGTVLTGILYTPAANPPGSRPSFILAHGWTSDVMRSTAHWLGLRLAQRGYAVLAVRHRHSGFRGAVRGRFEDVLPDLAAWTDLMAARSHARIVGIGHSVGTLWLSHYLATTKDARLKGLIYLAPQRDLPTHARTAMGEDLYARTVLEAQEAVRDGKGGTHLIQAPFPRAIYDDDDRQPMFISAPTSGVTYYYADAFLSYWGPESKAVHTRLVKDLKVPLLALGGARDPFMQGAWLIRFTEAAGPASQFVFYGGPGGAPHSFEGFETRVTDDIVTWVAKTLP